MHHIDLEHLSFQQLDTLWRDASLQLHLPEAVAARIQHCRDYLDQKVQDTAHPVYGINTGFGSLYKHSIAPADLQTLQTNLVKSHACGMGAEVPQDVVRLMLVLKIQSLAYGNSGVQVVTVQRLIDFYNHHITPVVYQQGSLGASGDLAPLAHLSLPLLGLGEVYHNGQKRPAADVLAEKGWQPIAFQAKEGLALLNGTQFMAAYGAWCILKAQRIVQYADQIAAISLEAFDGRPEPFDARIHAIRPHAGQVAVAAHFRELLQGSELISRPKTHVQDPYSFRCVPQVHGASRDALTYVQNVFLTEINSVTDNPNVFPDDDVILSGGNFHGQPLALAFDLLGIALAELGNISERRVYQLISGLRGLPDFLVANAGLQSGLMIPQYTAASIVSQNKQLCSPASVDSIVSSNGQEDHVSMGANAATKTYRIVENVERLFAVELLTASQAMAFRAPAKTSPVLEDLLARYRQHVPFIETDRILHDDLQISVAFVQAL
ncbi:histidine ammonia-lyase [Flexibacter flexilis DSM 6793]|uniref:Histidine ammonia-lyase n=1 Tax=Flexibacter flexilis DSM 6793 TaxID=927664 RepID=A0A1I1HX48_9BACT|nr:histidine ammonia-lyase [Flexibacter flexilis]SFC25530.1 histidine ammonia-lyase [Flexibacter flexilis DSM 6793]